ncbi:MAG: hypothetical protein M0D55_14025 [Elusimicrobiota bacterium]|nr:MAG: hypothetical protein M0D55_14025 [Elusimicrobiota bacterium]
MREAEFTLGAAKTSPKLDGLLAESQALEAKLTPERRAVHRTYRETLENVHSLSARMGRPRPPRAPASRPSARRPAPSCARSSSRPSPSPPRATSAR